MELWILCQIREGLCPILTCIIFVEGKYLDFKIFPTRKARSWTSLHTCFANKALFKVFESLKPKPPCDLVSPSNFHFLQWILDSFVIWPHQNMDLDNAISLQIFWDKENILIVYVGIAWITTFKSTSLHAWDKKYSSNFWFRPKPYLW